MKFRTRLRVTFVTIILLPLILTMLAFLSFMFYLTSTESEEGRESLFMGENIQDFVASTDKVYFVLLDQIRKDPARLEDKTFLAQLNAKTSHKSSYLIVRKGEELYYAGDPASARKIFDKLPDYGDDVLAEETGYYFNDLEKYVKQIDFRFSDGSEGSVFIVTKVYALISKHLLIYMLVAMIVILLLTSIMLTQWIQKSVFRPINKLNTAMQHIKDGNLDYMLENDGKGEIGDMYRNYEDMRLRLKESEEEKQENIQRNKEMIANISHDLKTPITAIKGYVEGIMDGVADTPEKMDKYIRTVYNKANDMDRLINELTTYSGVDNNRIQYNFHRINVEDYFGDCVEEVGLDLESKNIRLNYSNLADHNTIVIIDPEQMKKVINNIISNSVKYMDKPNGTIDIRILDEVDSIRVEIEDNGKGIAQKDLQRIFDRFYRTDASRNSAQGGSGIGLSIVKKIIEDHGGYIWATGKEGEGTCIHFVLRKYVELKTDN